MLFLPETCGQTRNIVFATKTFLNLLGNIFSSWETNYVSTTMLPEVGNPGNIGIVSVYTMSTSLLKALVNYSLNKKSKSTNKLLNT